MSRLTVEDAEEFERRVRALEALGHRGSATENEDCAADLLIAELNGMGIEGEKVAFPGHTSLGGRMLLHVVLAAAAAVLVLVAPIAAVVLGAAVAVSFFVEALTLGYVFSHLLPRPPSRNVVARIAATDSPRRRILLIGHMDTQRTGFMWRPEIGERFAKSGSGMPGPLKSPLFLVVLAMVLVPLVGVAALLGAPPEVVTFAVAVVLVIDAVASLILGDWARGPFVPGACDNATGAAAVLALAAAWRREPAPDVELALLLTGCEESGLGGSMAAAAAMKRDSGALPTTFINLDTLGYGAPRYIGVEYSYAATPVGYPADVLATCADAAIELGLEDAGPHTLPVCGDALPFLVRGIPGASILTFEPGPHMPNYHQMTDTADRMDFAIGWRAVEFGEAVLKRLRGAR